MKLSPEKRKELIEIQKEISYLEQKAEANINEDKSQLEFTKEELKGIPEKSFSQLTKVPNKEDHYFVRLNKE